MDGEEEVVQAVVASKATRADINAWFFNHFHQEVFTNNAVALERATAAKDDLLKLIGLS